MRYYPINLDLDGRRVLVVGGGVIAEGKTRQLIEAKAVVRVVSPALTEPMHKWVEQGTIIWRQGVFTDNDLEEVWLVISATDDQAVNEAVAQAAAERKLLCNVVDQTALCNFITPALITRGDIQISISSGGGSPSVAQRVKREIGELISEEYGELLEIAAEMRAEAKRLIPDFERRRIALHAFAESKAIELLRQGKREEARELAFNILEESLREQHQQGESK